MLKEATPNVVRSRPTEGPGVILDGPARQTAESRAVADLMRAIAGSRPLPEAVRSTEELAETIRQIGSDEAVDMANAWARRCREEREAHLLRSR